VKFDPIDDQIPEWALKEACRRLGVSLADYCNDCFDMKFEIAIEELAKMIAKHEEPPVDPFVEAVEEALNWWDNHTNEPDPVGEFVKILQRRGMELARAEEA